MKTLLLVLFLIITGITNAQLLKATEMLEKTQCKTFNCFDDFITKKGFSFDKTDSTKRVIGMDSKQSSSDSYFYKSDAFVKLPNSDFQARNETRLTISKSKKISIVGFKTADKDYYQKLLTEFKSKGFVAGKAETKGNGIITIYTSGTYPGYFLLVVVSKEDITNYDLELHRDG